MPSTRERLSEAGNRLLTAVGDWTAPVPEERPGFSDSGMSTLVRIVTAVAGVLFLVAMVVIWLIR